MATELVAPDRIWKKREASASGAHRGRHLHRLREDCDANGSVTRYAYDPLDRLATATDAMARVTQFTYTTLGQPYRAFNPGISTVNPLLTQTWTADGQLASLADANGNATAFTYDGFDRPTTTTYPAGSSEILAYDTGSNVTSRTTRAGQPIAYAYDTLNRLTTKTPPRPLRW